MTATVPLAVTVTDFVIDVPKETLPKERDVVLRLSPGVAALSCKATALEVLPVVAVRVTDCVPVTEDTFAMKDVLVAATGTVTELGTETAALLDARMILTPPAGAEPDRLTVQASAIDPVMDVLLQLTALMVGVNVVPVPLRLTVAGDALLEIVSCPVVEFADVGSNLTVSTVACPGFSVTGKLPPARENPVPDVVAALIVTAAVPLEVTVTEFATAVPTGTLPNESDVVLNFSADVAAFSCSEIALALLPVDAVRVADCVLVTETTLAMKDVLVAAAGTVTELGTETAELLVASTTLTPPAGAELDSVTVQESAIDPVMEVLLHFTALTPGVTSVPVPLRLTATEGALLDKVNCPVTELAWVGSN